MMSQAYMVLLLLFAAGRLICRFIISAARSRFIELFNSTLSLFPFLYLSNNLRNTMYWLLTVLSKPSRFVTAVVLPIIYLFS